MLAALFVVAAFGCGESPGRPIRIEVGYPPGGGADAIARVIAKDLGRILGTRTVVENRPGGAGRIAAQMVAHAPRDGYTLLVAATGAVTLAPLLDPQPAYAPDTDLCPLALLGETPHVLLVKSSFAARSVAELIALARERPGALSYASLGNGSSAHAIGALFANEAGIVIDHAPYRGSAPAVNDLLGGHVAMMFGTLQATLPMIVSGQVRALAVSGELRSRRLPSVPTFAELGFASLTLTSWYGLFAPCGLPADIAARLDAGIRETLAQGALSAVVEGAGSEFRFVVGDDFARFLRAERSRWEKAATLLGPSTGATPQR